MRDFNKRVKVRRDPAGALGFILEDKAKEYGVQALVEDTTKRMYQMQNTTRAALTTYQTGLTEAQKEALARLESIRERIPPNFTQSSLDSSAEMLALGVRALLALLVQKYKH